MFPVPNTAAQLTALISSWLLNPGEIGTFMARNTSHFLR
jgi:hypothetical protein